MMDKSKQLLARHFWYLWGHWKLKAKELKESILFAWDVSAWDVIFESDSKIVCDVVIGCSEPPFAISTLIEGIRLKLQDF